MAGRSWSYTLFFYKHKLYKLTQAEKALIIKHMLSIIRAWDLIQAFSDYLKHEHLIRRKREKEKNKRDSTNKRVYAF